MCSKWQINALKKRIHRLYPDIDLESIDFTAHVDESLSFIENLNNLEQILGIPLTDPSKLADEQEAIYTEYNKAQAGKEEEIAKQVAEDLKYMEPPPEPNPFSTFEPFQTPPEEKIEKELKKVLEADNQLEALMRHLETMIAGETEAKKAITTLLTSGKSLNPKNKQMILLKANGGAGKSNLMNKLTKGYLTKSVGRFTAHALDYSDLNKYEILSLTEFGTMDNEKNGVSTIKFLSSEDGGYTTEFTSRNEKGKLCTEVHHVPPITAISSTARTNLDPQMERRIWQIPVDESEQQSRLIANHIAKRELQQVEKNMGLRLATDEEIAEEVYSRFVKQFQPIEANILFPKTLLETLPMNALRVRGDFSKLLTFVELYAGFNRKRLMKIHGRYFITPEVAIEALKIVAPFLSSMLSKIDDRTVPLMDALKGTELSHKGGRLTKQVRDNLACKLGKSERTIRDLLNILADSGYVSSDGQKPATYELLYEVSEIELKRQGLSTKLLIADVLMEEMWKEAENQPILGWEVKKFREGDPYPPPCAIPPLPPPDETPTACKINSSALSDNSNVNLGISPATPSTAENDQNTQRFSKQPKKPEEIVMFLPEPITLETNN